jgi:predicted phage tail protein
VITFSDNGVDGSAAPSDAMFRYRFNAFQKSRGQANDPDAPAYSLLNRPMNYATAVTGVRDLDGVTIPVRLTSSTDGEGAQDDVRLVAPPAPTAIDLTATVTIPDSTRAYNVYLYDDFAKVPVSNFNASAANAVQSWTIPPGSGATWSKTITTMSDQTRVFRAVPISAP